MKLARRSVLLVAAFFMGLASPAFAHDGVGVAGGFVAGVLHPVSGLDHLLAMVAVGIWGVFLGKPLIWALPITFPLMMVVGGAIGILGVPLPIVEPGIAASVIVIGGAIAFAWRAAPPSAIVTIAAFAVFHGYAHGTELPEAANAASYATGFVLSTGLLHLSGIALGLLAGSRRGRVALRGTGGLIALAGAWILVA